MDLREVILITGATGQDARLLVELLGISGVSIVCCSKDIGLAQKLYKNVQAEVVHEPLDISNTDKFMKLINRYEPKRIFNLAGLSSVVNSYTNPKTFLEINGYAVERILIRMHSENLLGKIRFYQAVSSEIFDPFEITIRNESSNKKPMSPYGWSKLYAFEVCKSFREKYGYFITSGILFNHESEYRSEDFLFGKVTNSLARIKLGIQNQFSVENIHSQRDWGHARDYVRAMDLMSTSETPKDYVVATGQLRNVKNVIDIASSICDLPNVFTENFFYSENTLRKQDYKSLFGDSTKIRLDLDWTPEYNFESTVQQIQEAVLQQYYSTGY
jgi:GDPmannose 4,6-dehydratase